jgi:hypothetical protein
MDDERHAVRGQLHVELHVTQAESQRSLEGRLGVLGEVLRVAAVCDDFGDGGAGGPWLQSHSAGLARL